MSRKQPKRRAGNMVFSAIAGIFIFAIVCGVGFGVASADSANDAVRADSFGLAPASVKAADNVHLDAPGTSSQGVFCEQSVLASTSERTIESGFKMIDDRERAEAKRTAADNVAVFDRIAAEKAKQGVSHAAGQDCEYGLPAIDWSVGKDAFIEEWTARIDTYLAGSPLAGYGSVFAEAAWENGVDPRWSPAISNTESSKGSVCFLPHNAWGWGDTGWDDWETAIRTHVAGLASGYGYCITPEAAEKYCPPNHSFWYTTTHAQMAEI